ncbi:HlyD family efflux transporter periplasmic adaptor subunit [Comamonas sp.]|uniref:efflux RND transporter periplasmic adaptor subunit n=1 Tax=Comamonas sp. TaxID=34028 RepID=UPI0012D0BD5C|nr:HlyD family efflux transporter periplasmic adaptor subunit [Comamonas sp.]MPT13168.1 HlyD family efflux transporter periplasmic adaptor subunit [Comamonas sp.]
MNAAVSPQSANPAMLLLELGHRARAARSGAELRFLLVNDSRLLVPYRQACLWLDNDGVTALSGVVETDRNTPYAQWLHGVGQFLQAQPSVQVRRIEPAQLPPELASSWNEWLGAHAIWVPLVQDAQTPVCCGGLLLSGAQPIEEQRFPLLAEWCHIWLHAYSALQAGQSRFWRKPALSRTAARSWWQRKPVWIIGGLIALGAVPVHMSVLAPGELVAAQPVVLRAPLDGVIDQIHVQPNQVVRKGERLFGLDEAQISSRLEVAQQALLTAEAEYRQSAQLALGDARSKAQLAALVGRIGEKRAEVQYLSDQRERSRVLAPEDGMVLFDSPTEWLGKPVQTGERVMRIARPDEVEIEAWVPIGDAIPLAQGSTVKLYLAANPMAGLEGKLRYMAYDANARPDGSYAYRVRASLSLAKEEARIGLKGTAKLQGDWVPLVYWVLRKPWAVLRQFIAW